MYNFYMKKISFTPLWLFDNFYKNKIVLLKVNFYI